MHRSSLRVRLLGASVLFAVVVVGGFALTTYVVVSEGMSLVVLETAERVGASAGVLVGEASIDAEFNALKAGLVGEEAQRTVRADLLERVPALFSGAGLEGTRFSLRGANDERLWASNPDAERLGNYGNQMRALRTGRLVVDASVGRLPAPGLLSDANLGTTIVHVPVDLPFREKGVLNVAYDPESEERVIDAIRGPMVALALTAMFVMVALMQTSMSWVLGLVADLRGAADSIDAGRLEERLPEKGTNEVAQLAISVNRLIDRLQRRAEAQSRFVGDASHELATPVAGIRGYTNILRAWGAEDEAVRNEAIDAIDRESRRMARLTSDLLSLLHADEGLRLKTERLDLNVLARERLAVTASRYIESGIEFVGPEEESLTMVGDPDRIEDVISILLDNAGKYTHEGGSVTLKTARIRDEVVITVSDTGEGIPPEDVPRLFDRFFRSEKSRAEGSPGFGLGLAIARSIVTSMGGTIEVESELGAGTTFTVTLSRGRV